MQIDTFPIVFIADKDIQVKTFLMAFTKNKKI